MLRHDELFIRFSQGKNGVASGNRKKWPLLWSIREREGDSGSTGTQKATRPLAFFPDKITHNRQMFLAHCDTVQGKRPSRKIVIGKTNSISMPYTAHHLGMNIAFL